MFVFYLSGGKTYQPDLVYVYIYICMYEGKSLNNRNFIITFLQEYLQKLFVSYFSTQSPCFATHLVHLSTCLRMPSKKKAFNVSLATLTGLPLRCSSLTFCRPF